MNAAELLKKHWYDFLAPRFWGMWLALGILRLVICLPYPLILKVGQGMGYLARVLLKGRYHITAVNLKLCFPELNEEARLILLKKSYTSLGVGILEAALAWWASDKRLLKMLEFQGLENLKQVREKNQGMLLIAGHFNSIELGLRLLSFKSPIDIMYRAQTNLLFEWILQRARRHYIQNTVTHNDIRGLLKSLQKGHVMCYTPDQDKGPDMSIFVPFFGVQAATSKATAKILQHTKAIPIPIVCVRDTAHRKYHITLLPMMKNYPTGDDIKDAITINQLIEKMIRDNPEQYMWQVQRFRTRPPGEPRMYD